MGDLAIIEEPPQIRQIPPLMHKLWSLPQGYPMGVTGGTPSMKTLLNGIQPPQGVLLPATPENILERALITPLPLWT